MGLSVKPFGKKSTNVARVDAEIEALKARIAALEGGSSQEDGAGTVQSRRDWLKLAAAAAAGAAGSIVLRGVPAEAVNGQPVLLGNSTTNDAGTTTDIFPTTATDPSPLFQATGQGVTTTTTVPPTANVNPNAPATQSIPLIGAIGAGGSLPPIGDPPVNDYPGWAPIQGVGGVATVVTSTGNQPVSEGLNGFGFGSTGVGVSGDSDIGYGVVGGSGGIDIAALGNGRIQQTNLLDADLTSPSTGSGPPSYVPNDFEQARDANGILWLSGAAGAWRRANTVRVDNMAGTGPFAPIRVVDTRSGSPALNWGHPGPLAQNHSYSFGPFTGTYGIPPDAIGIVGNLTAVGAVGPHQNNLPTFGGQGYLTIYPAGVAQPGVSNLNFGGPTYAWANSFTVGFGAGVNRGMFTIFVFNVPVHVVVDVFAYVQ